MDPVLILATIAKILSTPYTIRKVGLYEIPKCFAVHNIMNDLEPYKIQRTYFDNEELTSIRNEHQEILNKMNSGQEHEDIFGFVDFDIMYNDSNDTSLKMYMNLFKVKDNDKIENKTEEFELVCYKKDENQIIFKENDYTRRISRCLGELKRLASLRERFTRRTMKSVIETYEEIPFKYFANLKLCFEDFLIFYQKFLKESGSIDAEKYIEYYKKKNCTRVNSEVPELALNVLIDYCLLLRPKREPIVLDKSYSNFYPTINDYAMKINKCICIEIFPDIDKINSCSSFNEKLSYKFYGSNDSLINFNIDNIKTFSNLILIPFKDLIESDIYYVEIRSKSIATQKINITDFIYSKKQLETN